MNQREWKELVDAMFKLEESDPNIATKFTMEAIRAGWPYSMSGLGFGRWEHATARMRRHAPVLLRKIRKHNSNKKSYEFL